MRHLRYFIILTPLLLYACTTVIKTDKGNQDSFESTSDSNESNSLLPNQNPESYQTENKLTEDFPPKKVNELMDLDSRQNVEITGQSIILDDDKQIFVNLYELKLIDQIRAGNGNRFIIFSGKECFECDANTSLYIHPVKSIAVDTAKISGRYSYPGSVYYYEDGSLLYDARVFYGQILNGITGIIWFQKEQNEESEWEESIYLVDVTNGTIKDTFLTYEGQLDETLRLEAEGFCQEIPGVSFSSEP